MKPPRFSFTLPLSVKILIWFFLNLAGLAVVFILLFNAQFRFDLNWVFASSARQRVDAVRNLIVGELNTATPDDWDGVLDRFSEAYHVRFELFDDHGEHLVGPVAKLPEAVRARIELPPPPFGRERPGQEPPTHRAGPEPPRSNPPGPTGEGWGGPPGRAFMRTTGPTRYWLLLRARLENPQAGYPMRVTLVAEANSLNVGGLILDPAPWLRMGLGAVVFSVLFWLPLLRGITRSIGQMTETTRQIAEGRFYVRVSSKRRDELGALAEAINQMASRLDGFVQGQKRFLGDVAHELCSPLARLQMTLGIIEQRADERQKDYAKAATEKAGQIASLVNELLAFSKASFRASSVQLQPVNVLEAVEKAVRQEASEGGSITVDVPGALTVLADGEVLVRALANLVRNALHHGGESGTIAVSATHDIKSGTVAISIADSGPGVPEGELAKIFDAFYRLDASRTRETGGVGLGLTIVKACIESCHGSVIARNRSPHGLEMIIHLPQAYPRTPEAGIVDNS